MAKRESTVLTSAEAVAGIGQDGDAGEAGNDTAAVTPAITPNDPPLPISERNASGRSGVSDAQQLAITALLCGQSMDEAAKAAGVCRKTLYNWRHEDERFMTELERRRRDVCDEAADRLRGLLSTAVDALVAQLHNTYYTDDRVRFRAAVAILRLANVRAGSAADRGGARRDHASTR